MADLRWQSYGGVLIDGTGDLALTTSAQEEIETMVATRLKASLNSWKLYSIGAGLDSFEGSPLGINQNTTLAIQRQVNAALTYQLLPAGSFTVSTVVFGNEVEVLVYIGKSLVASTTVSV
jgi:hypothetical protein